MRLERLGAAAAALLASLILASCMTNKVEIGSPDLSRASDGAWKGYYDGKLVKVEVEVGIADRRIESIEILRHECGKGKPAERIVDSVVAAQSLQVDVVSGASYSSKCILKAIEVAIEAASRG
jgi:uncharacterized protein with FMN-binding domain